MTELRHLVIRTGRNTVTTVENRNGRVIINSLLWTRLVRGNKYLLHIDYDVLNKYRFENPSVLREYGTWELLASELVRVFGPEFKVQAP